MRISFLDDVSAPFGTGSRRFAIMGSSEKIMRGEILRVWGPMVLGLYAIYKAFTGGPGPRDEIRMAGLMFSVIGFGGVIVARFTLGKSFSVAARARELVTTGIYSRIRNPIYIFGLICFVGFWTMFRIPAMGLLFLVLIPMQVWRAKQEARVLEEKFGEEYRRYRARTWF
jgi:protein-S-isoprenylcysteine O-methyltransferase Ste14